MSTVMESEITSVSAGYAFQSFKKNDHELQEKSYPVLGVPISPHSNKEFFECIEGRLKINNPGNPPLFIVTVNPEIVVQTITDNTFKQILVSSSINTADGVGISWAVKKLYGKKVERITGSDSLEKICAISARHGQSVFFYGAAPGIAEKASEILKERIPGLNFEGTFSPETRELQLEDLPDEVSDGLKRAEVIFVALGAPAQEKWIYNNLKKLPNCKVIVGVGGSFDFITGNIKRAPSWMCKLGIEWVYRLWLQPSRWRRMLKLPVFAMNVIFLKWID
jgi:N-acetylglucosaminyldiphosphoundecaprenol N-acetyl-beta-D-mannosaminyltransferase